MKNITLQVPGSQKVTEKFIGDKLTLNYFCLQNK
jgi:hypothetical protein